MAERYDQSALQDFLQQQEMVKETQVHRFRIIIHIGSTLLGIVSRITIGTQFDILFLSILYSLPVFIILDVVILIANPNKKYHWWIKYLASLADILYVMGMVIVVRAMLGTEFFPMMIQVPAFIGFFVLQILSGYRINKRLMIVNGLAILAITVILMIVDLTSTAIFNQVWFFSYLTVIMMVFLSIFATAFISGYTKNIIEENYRRLEEKLYVTGVFGRYVSSEVAEKALSGELVLGGEEKVISVLFCDIRNFTSLSESSTPSEVVSLLNRFFSLMTPAITGQEGIVDKMIGDCLMALFGAPIPRDDFRLRAVRAAMQIREQLIRLNHELSGEGKPEISIGIGIATGPAIVGNIGCIERMEYTAIGDTVNTASRIESLCKHFERTLLVDEHTREGLDGFFELDKMEPAEVKGKKDKIQVYAVETKIME